MGKSYFDGGAFQLIGWKFLAYLLTAVTFGIGYPWAMCMLQRWAAKHTVIGSKRLVFNGKGARLFGLWILLSLIPYAALFFCAWLILKLIQNGMFELIVLVSLCIFIGVLCYSAIVTVQIKKWTVKNTVFQDGFEIPGGTSEGWASQANPQVDAQASAAVGTYSGGDNILSSLFFLAFAVLVSVTGLAAMVFQNNLMIGIGVVAAGLILLLVSYFNQ